MDGRDGTRAAGHVRVRIDLGPQHRALGAQHVGDRTGAIVRTDAVHVHEGADVAAALARAVHAGDAGDVALRDNVYEAEVGETRHGVAERALHGAEAAGGAGRGVEDEAGWQLSHRADIRGMYARGATASSSADGLPIS